MVVSRFDAAMTKHLEVTKERIPRLKQILIKFFFPFRDHLAELSRGRQRASFLIIIRDICIKTRLRSSELRNFIIALTVLIES